MPPTPPSSAARSRSSSSMCWDVSLIRADRCGGPASTAATTSTAICPAIPTVPSRSGWRKRFDSSAITTTSTRSLPRSTTIPGICVSWTRGPSPWPASRCLRPTISSDGRAFTSPTPPCGSARPSPCGSTSPTIPPTARGKCARRPTTRWTPPGGIRPSCFWICCTPTSACWSARVPIRTITITRCWPSAIPPTVPTIPSFGPWKSWGWCGMCRSSRRRNPS
mmetsp:Transcript_9374/g.22127  ORF Transcript_9374/g.22127 Transcript_9374/m.22127 type:complete len:222 (+) Transcript_9374:189-854(+)